MQSYKNSGQVRRQVLMITECLGIGSASATSLCQYEDVLRVLTENVNSSGLLLPHCGLFIDSTSFLIPFASVNGILLHLQSIAEVHDQLKSLSYLPTL